MSYKPGRLYGVTREQYKKDNGLSNILRLIVYSLFFSASIPCILSTEIQIKLKDIVIIWFERLVLGLILATIQYVDIYFWYKIKTRELN